MKYVMAQILLVIAIILAGCGGGSEKSNITVLEGKWTSTCAVDGEDYFIFTLTFSGNLFDSSLQKFLDSSCTTADVNVDKTSFSGNFKIGRIVTTSSGINATEYDVNILLVDGVTGNTTIYSLFNIDNEKLYVGDLTGEFDGSTKEKRAIDLNFDFYYTKM